MSQKFFQELVTSRKNYPGGDGIVGQVGRLWFENETNSIRLSDGVRPGGRIITNGVWYNNSTNSLMWTDPETNIEYIIASAGPRAANQLTNGSVTLTLNEDGSVSFPNYTFPANDGAANQVLVTDGAGTLSWRDQTGGTGGNSHVTISDTAPLTPAEGDIWYDSTSGRTYIYYGDAWVDSNPSRANSRVTVSDTAPVNSTEGDLWYDSTAGKTYIYYGDAWVDSNPSGTTRSTVSSVPPPTAYLGDLWYDITAGRTYIYYENTWVDSNPQGDFRVKIGNTAPRRPVAGDLWYNTNVLKTLIYVGGDWVDANPPGSTINRIIDIPDVYTGGVGNPNLVDNSTLIYSASQTRWETKPLDSVQINLDGGGY